MSQGQELPTDPEALLSEDEVLEYGDYVETITALGDEFRFRVAYTVLVLPGPTVDEVADAVDRPVDEVTPVIAELIQADVVAEKMACLVDCEQDVYELTVLAREYFRNGPLAVLGDED